MIKIQEDAMLLDHADCKVGKRLVLIGGLPGTGKTYIGREIAPKIGAFIDKDTVSGLASEYMLEKLGSHKNDRESDLYKNSIRSIEYQTMMDIAYENIEIGIDVVCAAPFAKEFRNKLWLDDLACRAKIDTKIFKVWVTADESTMKRRIIERNARRDDWKLLNWSAYLGSVPHDHPSIKDVFVIDNSDLTSTPLSKQLAILLGNMGVIHDAG